jgi:hypothetical protein
MKIEFFPSSKDAELFVPPPVPAKKCIPEWYKKSFPANFNNPQFSENGDFINKSIKQCIPFLDSFLSGYIQNTWCDIYIENSNGQIRYIWARNPQIISSRDEKNIHAFDGFYDLEFVWKEQWLPKLPDGYSMVYTHPFNRYDLPFISLTAIVDSDKYYHSYNGNYPFYIKNNFIGLIPEGTPMYQMIPIKRNNWKSKINKYDEISNKKREFIIKNKFWSGYKQRFWEKKNYE